MYQIVWTQADILVCDARQVLDLDKYMEMADEVVRMAAGRKRVAVLVDRTGIVEPPSGWIVEFLLEIMNRVSANIGYVVLVGAPSITRLALPRLKRLYNINMVYTGSLAAAERMARAWLDDHALPSGEDQEDDG